MEKNKVAWVDNEAVLLLPYMSRPGLVAAQAPASARRESLTVDHLAGGVDDDRVAVDGHPGLQYTSAGRCLK